MKRGRKPKLIKKGKLKCANCGRFLSIDLFTRSPRYKSGYRSYCRECEKLRRKGVWSIKGKVVKDFGIWLTQTERKCEYCGIDEKDIKKLNDGHIIWGRYNYLTIDRKDSSRGYELDNICLACMRCNRIKSNIFTYEEMKIIGKMLENKNKKKLV
jgi:5-methylcytosine-specific restriction endonuclease McrA